MISMKKIIIQEDKTININEENTDIISSTINRKDNEIIELTSII